MLIAVGMSPTGGKGDNDCRRSRKEIDMDYDSLLELVKRRRSRRRFKPDPIPDEFIDKIIEVARWAPSGANSQPWEFIVVKDKEIKDKIVGIVNEHSEYGRKVELTREEDLRWPSAAEQWDSQVLKMPRPLSSSAEILGPGSLIRF